MTGILRDSAAELLERKVLWVYGFLAFMGILTVVGLNAADVNIGGQQLDLTEVNRELGNPLLLTFNWIAYWILVPLTVMLTAGVLPNMLVKGRAEYYLSQPISRASLLLQKLFSTWILYSTLVCACLLTVWIIAGVLLGLFDSRVFGVLGIHTVSLLVWFSITFFAGVVSRSTPMSMMAAFLVWLAQAGLASRELLLSVIDSRPFEYFFDILYYILPKTGEMNDLASQYLSGAGHGANWMPLYTSLLFAGVLIFVTIHVFNRRDY